MEEINKIAVICGGSCACAGGAIFFKICFDIRCILFALIRPLCRSPIFIVPFLKEGTSIRPLEELPITPSTYFKHDKYFQ